MKMKRCSGVLLPISALPSRFGVGDFGLSAYRFASLLKEGGFSLWQILPLNPLGYGHSPYQPFSSYAFDEIYIDLDALEYDIPSFNEHSPKVDYEAVREYKTIYLKKIYHSLREKNQIDVSSFIKRHKWVRDWAIFMVNKKKNDLKCWNEWKEEDKESLSHKRKFFLDNKEECLYEIWLQQVLYSQWDRLHKHLRSLGIKVIGDLPFYVGYDSCDVYANQDKFLLNKKSKEPSFIAGVPPDYFSKTGQRWGNPIYNFKEIKKESYSFIIDRVFHSAKIYDIVRLDHFRAFDTYWKIKASCPTAEDGKWVLGPGYKLFNTLKKKYPRINIIAEDLGELRPEVYKLRDFYSFPGMNVVEFTFVDEEVEHKSKIDKENMVAYLGTHDNDPFLSFFDKLSDYDKYRWSEAIKNKGIEFISPNDAFLHYLFSLKASYAIICMQDILGLGEESRLNTPGLINASNWAWRMASFSPFEEKIKYCNELNKRYQR